MSGSKFRYYAVGEYGEKTWRPHYHMLIFGYPNCIYGSTDVCMKKIIGGCNVCRLARRIWKKGHVFLGDISSHSVQYVAGYVTKFSAKKKDEKLRERYPEYSVMSLKPGIGATALDLIAAAVNIGKKRGLYNENEVPTCVKVSGKEWPLGRYLSGKLREKCGQGKEVPKDKIEEIGFKMRFLLEENIKEKGWPKVGDLSTIVTRINKQQVDSLEKRENIYKSRRII